MHICPLTKVSFEGHCPNSQCFWNSPNAPNGCWHKYSVPSARELSAMKGVSAAEARDMKQYYFRVEAKFQIVVFLYAYIEFAPDVEPTIKELEFYNKYITKKPLNYFNNITVYRLAGMLKPETLINFREIYIKNPQEKIYELLNTYSVKDLIKHFKNME